MTDPHTTSKAVHGIECENGVLREVIDMVFQRGALKQSEKNKLAGVLHNDEVLTENHMAKALVRLYGEKVKSCKDPSSQKRDTSRPQAVHNVVNLLEKGMGYDRLVTTVFAAGVYYDSVNAAWEHRPNAGNFFGRKQVYKDFLPETETPVGDAAQAEKVNGLFDGRDE